MNDYDLRRHRRRSIRLKGYDYTQAGAYFVTICTHQRAHLFGRVVDGETVLNAFGRIVWDEWFRTADLRPHVELFEDEFVIMPNHIHGIIRIVDVGARRRRAPTEKFGRPVPIPTIIRAFKSAVTKRINAVRGTPGATVWQRNYYEHIIRSERALTAIRRYIMENPMRWHLDRHNPDAVGSDPQARVHPRRGAAALRPYKAYDHPAPCPRSGRWCGCAKPKKSAPKQIVNSAKCSNRWD